MFVFGCPFLLFLICARLQVLQSFKMDSDEESEVEVSSRDGEGEFSVFRTFLKEMFHRVVRNVAFIWPPLC